ncbi:hypothetical protein [Spirillospora sp. NPDC029432]|uniref:hypothetical protein n=1 Tax=Spirillospora sp. NPDC029432 TaxID=3154599 RepID=UPI003456C58B
MDVDETRRLMARSGLTPTDTELTAFAAALDMQRAGIDLLYAVPEARYADPALRFQAGARVTPWTDPDPDPE